MLALRIALLAIGVAGAVVRPRGVPAYVAPLGCAVVLVASGSVSLQGARVDAKPLGQAVGFLLAAVPLAALLDRAGVFDATTNRIVRGTHVVPGLWILAVATTALLNLDASVVLLTPLYARVAKRLGLPVLVLAVQPLVLSYLASSLLPVSNLTNLIAVSRTGVSTATFLEHLAPASLAASGVGYLFYRRWAAPLRRQPPGDSTSGAPARLENADGVQQEPSRERHAMWIGGAVLAVLLVGFLLGPAVGVRAWQVALGVDVGLMALTRSVPWRSIPWGTALVALALGVLAAAVASSLSLGFLVGSHGAVGMLRTAGIGAGLGNLVDNLPALLVMLPVVVAHHPDQLWALLVGVNMGPALVATGTLAALLWREQVGASGVRVRAGEIFSIGVRVTIPAALAGTAVLLATTALLGGG